MSKEKDKILRTLEHIAIIFDKLGFSPTIPICTGHKDFNYLFRLEIDTIKELCDQQAQRIAELEEQLKNKQAEVECVEETIKLELPKFEDFREPISFVGQDNIKYWITKWQDYICILGNDNIFRLICDYTKENYIEVCKKAKELFLKGAKW